MMFWDMLALGGYLVLNVVITRVTLEAERTGAAPPRWIRPVIVLSIPWAISIHTVTAFLYNGLPGRSFWLTAMLAPRFLASAFAAGPALLDPAVPCSAPVVVASMPAREPIGRSAVIVTYATAVHVFFVLLEVFTVVLQPGSGHVEHFTYLYAGLDGHAALVPWMWTSVGPRLAVAGRASSCPRRGRATRTLAAACAAVFVSLWIDKGLGLVVGGFVPSPLGAVADYVPTLARSHDHRRHLGGRRLHGDRVLQDHAGSQGEAYRRRPHGHPRRASSSRLSGDSGKTLVSLWHCCSPRAIAGGRRGVQEGTGLHRRGLAGVGVGTPARNLDTFLAGHVRRRVGLRASTRSGPGSTSIEGNRGLFDGVDAEGTHSTPELAKLLGAPVVLVVNARKMTERRRRGPRLPGDRSRMRRSPASFSTTWPDTRHEGICREAIESLTGVPVLGALPRVSEGGPLPGRHLGLVPPDEYGGSGERASQVARMIRERVDVDAVLRIAASAPALPAPGPAASLAGAPDGRGLVIGVVRDSAFTFYYPENLEALEATGARLASVSSLDDNRLPPGLDALYIGGGFPETHGRRLAANAPLLSALHGAACAGLPIYAECGGLMLLARAIRWRGEVVPMAGVLPFEVEVHERPRAHGYARLRVDRPNAFFPEGAVLDGHQFHYSWPDEGAGSRAGGVRGRARHGRLRGPRRGDRPQRLGQLHPPPRARDTGLDRGDDPRRPRSGGPGGDAAFHPHRNAGQRAGPAPGGTRHGGARTGWVPAPDRSCRRQDNG